MLEYPRGDIMEDVLNVDLLYDLIERKDYQEIRERLTGMNEVNVAELLKDLPPHAMVLVFRLLEKDLAAEVFAYLPKKTQNDLINSITDKEVKDIIEELFFDDIVDLVDEMPANFVNRIIKYTNKEERSLINHFLNYPDDSAGSLMTIEFVHLKKEYRVKDALDHIREIGMEKETVYTCYVTDAYRRLEGIVSLRKLVISDPTDTIDDIMERDIVYASSHDDREEVSLLFQKYGFLAIPVVDKEKRLIGIITVDDMLEVIEQEATEDFHIMAAMSPEETPYLETSVLRLAMNRLPWLLILMISETFTGSIMMKYENMLQTVAVLSAFIPMLMDTGGNTGSQASTLVIRGLAVGEIEPKDFLKITFKELRVALIVGIALATVNFLRLVFFSKVGVDVALTVCLTLVVCVSIAKLVGGNLPLLAKRLGFDPAIMASPFITTIVDAITLMVYFNIASKILFV